MSTASYAEDGNKSRCPSTNEKGDKSSGTRSLHVAFAFEAHRFAAAVFIQGTVVGGKVYDFRCSVNGEAAARDDELMVRAVRGTRFGSIAAESRSRRRRSPSVCVSWYSDSERSIAFSGRGKW